MVVAAVAAMMRMKAWPTRTSTRRMRKVKPEGDAAERAVEVSKGGDEELRARDGSPVMIQWMTIVPLTPCQGGS